MIEAVLTVPFWLEFTAVLTGGLSGAMSAVRARYDIFGVVCIAIITGLAGGMLRDVLLQSYGIYAFQQPTLLIACIVAAVIVFYFGKLTTYLDPVVDLLDNVSVGIWAIISVGKAASAGLDIIPSVILGTIAAVGGGIIRDICMNREPAAFQVGTLYGSVVIIGAIVYAILHEYNFLPHYDELIGISIILVVRYASLFFGWKTSEPRDYSDVVVKVVTHPVRSVARRVSPPKGKIERERERDAAREVVRKLWQALGNPAALTTLKQEHPEAKTPSTQTTQHAKNITSTDDLSDRIRADREEVRRILEESNEQEKPAE